jgi:GMP synthase-like glutamine amidotransferase
MKADADSETMRILVLEHEPECPAALFGDWAGARGHEVRTVRVPELARWPQPDAADVVVSLGSDRSTHASTDSWIAREIEFLLEVHDAGRAVLGICFGAQALAKALGGAVTSAPQMELGWTTLDTRDPALIPPGPWCRWHEDVFRVPPAAREIVRAGEVPLAFVQGTSVGVQFHPEVDLELVDAWIEGSRRRLAEEAVDERALRRRMRLAAPGARARAYDLFDRIARLWSGQSGAEASCERRPALRTAAGSGRAPTA